MPSATPRGGNAPSRTTRSSAGPSRGGISKAGRSAAVRVDRDGDLNMDASGVNGAGKKSGAGAIRSTQTSRRASTRASGPTRDTKINQQIARHLGASDLPISTAHRSARTLANTTTLRIEGMRASKAATNADGGLAKLLEFLERKAAAFKKTGNRRVAIKKSLVRDDYVHVLVSSEDAEHVVKLNSFTFAGSTLKVKEEKEWPSRDSAASSVVPPIDAAQKANLEAVLRRRFQPDSKYMDLSALGQDQQLMEMNFFQSKGKPEKAFGTLMAIIKTTFPDRTARQEAIQRVSLAFNALNDVALVNELADTLPDLKGLDLSNNLLANLSDLDKWRNRLNKLDTLIITDNPIETQQPDYQATILTWFPMLTTLNKVQVRTAQQIEAAVAAKIATPIPQFGTDFNDPSGLGQLFVRQFLLLFDSDRKQLLSLVYDEQSTFSVSVANGLPRDKGNDLAPTPWGDYLKWSRNQARITTAGARTQRFFVGDDIATMWALIPKTKHPELDNNVEKYILDSHPLGGLVNPEGHSLPTVPGLHITMHGQFEELAENGKVGLRSFTRSFVLGPARNTGDGRPLIRVNSDMLCLRAWNALPAVTSVVGGASPAAPAPGLTAAQQKEAMLTELVKVTHMTAVYATMCLDMAQWDYPRAVAIFEEKRASLPAEAFTHS